MRQYKLWKVGSLLAVVAAVTFFAMAETPIRVGMSKCRSYAITQNNYAASYNVYVTLADYNQIKTLMLQNENEFDIYWTAERTQPTTTASMTTLDAKATLILDNVFPFQTLYFYQSGGASADVKITVLY